jgi:hypothetical protein
VTFHLSSWLLTGGADVPTVEGEGGEPSPAPEEGTMGTMTVKQKDNGEIVDATGRREHLDPRFPGR